MTELLASPAPSLVGEDIDQELVCTDVLAVTHDVATFVLESPDGRLFGFRPGQHLTVSVDAFGVPVERCYTISSPPTRPGALAITVKRVPDGPMSNWLHDHLFAGGHLRATGPLGRFTMDAHPASRHLFLGAGSGITPLMSMARTLHDLADPHDLVLVHSARTPGDVVFRDELAAMAEAGTGIRVATVCERVGDEPGWDGEIGRLTLPMLQRIAPDLLDREVFVCGPAAYMESVRELLDGAGVDPARVHQESFVLGSPTAPEEVVALPTAASAPTSYAVELRRSGRVLECDAGTSVLDAAARAGVTLPSSCGQGVCGTCKLTLLEGTVDMQHAGGIRPREVARQQILVCCSTPLENLVLDA